MKITFTLHQNEYFKEKAEIRVESYLIFPIAILRTFR